MAHFGKIVRAMRLHHLYSFFMYINVVCRSQAENSYFSVDFRLEIFLNYF